MIRALWGIVIQQGLVIARNRRELEAQRRRDAEALSQLQAQVQALRSQIAQQSQSYLALNDRLTTLKNYQNKMGREMGETVSRLNEIEKGSGDDILAWGLGAIAPLLERLLRLAESHKVRKPYNLAEEQAAIAAATNPQLEQLANLLLTSPEVRKFLVEAGAKNGR